MSNSYAYKTLGSFGPNMTEHQAVINSLHMSTNSNMDQRFLSGSGSAEFVGQNSGNSGVFLAEHCSKNWDGVCELASTNDRTHLPPAVSVYNGYDTSGFTVGENLLRSTALKKYLSKLKQCKIIKEQLNPLVPESPYIERIALYNSDRCYSEFAVDLSTDIDNDPVLIHLLNKPYVAMDVLQGIYVSLKKRDELGKIKGTKLGSFFSTHFK